MGIIMLICSFLFLDSTNVVLRDSQLKIILSHVIVGVSVHRLSETSCYSCFLLIGCLWSAKYFNNRSALCDIIQSQR